MTIILLLCITIKVACFYVQWHSTIVALEWLESTEPESLNATTDNLSSQYNALWSICAVSCLPGPLLNINTPRVAPPKYIILIVTKWRLKVWIKSSGESKCGESPIIIDLSSPPSKPWWKSQETSTSVLFLPKNCITVTVIFRTQKGAAGAVGE